MAWIDVVLLGTGIGNATSLPPLIAQAEFATRETQRVVALIVALSQGCYGFAPVVFGALGTLASQADSATRLFVFAGIIQALAILAIRLGNRHRPQGNTLEPVGN